MELFQKTSDGENIINPREYETYLYIPGKYLTGVASTNRLTNTLDSPKGLYLHRMVVFSYGDCKGKKFTSDATIDHIDMNHKNCSVENLEIVSYGLNLFRAYYKTAYQSKGKNNFVSPTENLFKDFYNSLDRIDQKILDLEIQKEINNG